jgi:hypothetical protein
VAEGDHGVDPGSAQGGDDGGGHGYEGEGDGGDGEGGWIVDLDAENEG